MKIMRPVANPLLLITMLLSFTTVVLAQDAADLVATLQSRWDTVNYATAKDQQAAAFDALAERARNAANAHPDQAAVQIWTGIVLASAAGAHGERKSTPLNSSH